MDITVTVERVSIPAMSSIGFGYGRTEDGRYVEIAGDHRPMRDLGEAIAADGPQLATAPDYMVRPYPAPKEA